MSPPSNTFTATGAPPMTNLVVRAVIAIVYIAAHVKLAPLIRIVTTRISPGPQREGLFSLALGPPAPTQRRPQTPNQPRLPRTLHVTTFQSLVKHGGKKETIQVKRITTRCAQLKPPYSLFFSKGPQALSSTPDDSPPDVISATKNTLGGRLTVGRASSGRPRPSGAALKKIITFQPRSDPSGAGNPEQKYTRASAPCRLPTQEESVSMSSRLCQLLARSRLALQRNRFALSSKSTTYTVSGRLILLPLCCPGH